MARAAWNIYQEKVKDFLNEQPGVTAETNVTIQGVRSTHDIDVLAKFTALGTPIEWIIECKLWKTRVPKEKVLALRQIVDDAGADRGLLISEVGFQSGAIETAKKNERGTDHLRRFQAEGAG